MNRSDIVARVRRYDGTYPHRHLPVLLDELALSTAVLMRLGSKPGRVGRGTVTPVRAVVNAPILKSAYVAAGSGKDPDYRPPIGANIPRLILGPKIGIHAGFQDLVIENAAKVLEEFPVWLGKPNHHKILFGFCQFDALLPPIRCFCRQSFHNSRSPLFISYSIFKKVQV